ncbi:LytTR family DNA-binding domain-containing protein [Paraflavisolibacter sp. H34]|uniref:LytR/AlgR family response regulator transcription factor n=1 Tax=Huijunlia imazamoxiresistens TaxID=3127457 RepID=UPI003018738A
MKTAIIIEDEKAAAASLVGLLLELHPSLEIKAVLTSVEEGRTYFKDAPSADIIFSDVQLTDGLSFEIFGGLNLSTPIVFITGFDQFMIRAFEYNSIDYLLKPVCREDLQKALVKYKKLEQHFTGQHAFFRNFLQETARPKRTRLVVKKGQEHISLPLEDVALFLSENKVVYALDKSGRRLLTDKNLSDLEAELDPKTFFRANRQHIVNIAYIKSYKTYERVKLKVELALPDTFLIISQETAPEFKKWMAEL